MEQAAGQPADTSVFATDGRVRHRLVRAAAVTGVALLAAWLIALGLGVLGGFEGLPALPGIQSKSPEPASTHARAQRTDPRPASQPAVKARPQITPRAAASPASPSPVRSTSPPASPKKTFPTNVAPSPSTPTSRASSPGTTGRALGTTKTTTGKPLGSPGNGPGGSGAPGKLR
jgi:hypothetical protein